MNDKRYLQTFFSQKLEIFIGDTRYVSLNINNITEHLWNKSTLEFCNSSTPSTMMKQPRSVAYFTNNPYVLFPRRIQSIRGVRMNKNFSKVSSWSPEKWVTRTLFKSAAHRKNWRLQFKWGEIVRAEVCVGEIHRHVMEILCARSCRSDAGGMWARQKKKVETSFSFFPARGGLVPSPGNRNRE